MEGQHCPFIRKNCNKHECVLYVHLLGMNPQTGQPTEEWKCSLAFLPILMVENSNMIRQGTASTDKVATQLQKSRAEFIGALSEEGQKRLVQSAPKLLGDINGDP